jgi:hypothetical protein
MKFFNPHAHRPLRSSDAPDQPLHIEAVPQPVENIPDMF